MILVTGGTGTTGRELVRLLQQSGHPCRVLSRNAQAARVLLGSAGGLGPDTSIIEADLNHPDTLAAAFEGVDTLFLLVATDPRQVEQEGHTLEMAEAAGVQRIVKMSVLGASEDSPVASGRWHAFTERQLRESGFAVTILRPHSFMQNTLRFAASIASSGSFTAPMRDGHISMIDARDVAAVAHAALTSDEHAGRILDLTGPESLGYADVARILSEELERPVQYVDVPPNEAEQALVAAGMENWRADVLITRYGIYAAGHASECTTAVQDITGRAPRTYREFVRDHRVAFAVE